MNILVTGGAGFIGANFIEHLFASYDYTIVNLDLLTYAGDLENLKTVEHHGDYHFTQGDICDQLLVRRLLHEYDIQAIVNFAAESHVDRSIEEPSIFLKTNVLGTKTLLEEAKNYWKVNQQDKHCRKFKEGVRFVQISTDEVYGTLGRDGFFTEQTNLAPNSPYAASKASADMIVRAYHETYGLPTVTTRCSNNYGPYQNREKLMPLVIEKALSNQSIPLYGDGKQVRDWLYVKDHCSAIDTVLHKGNIGEVYNIGGNNEKENIEVVQLILKYLNKSEKQIEYVPDRLGHDQRYAIDHSKITNELNWSPIYTFEGAIEKTINWYLLNEMRGSVWS